jgi:hypothetical protein
MSFLEHGIKRYGHIIVKLDAFALKLTTDSLAYPKKGLIFAPL